MIGGVVEVRHCRPRFIRRVRRVRRVRFVSFTDVCQFWIKHTSCTHETKNIWMCCNHKSCALESTLFIRLWRMSILAIYMKWNGTTTKKVWVFFCSHITISVWFSYYIHRCLLCRWLISTAKIRSLNRHQFYSFRFSPIALLHSPNGMKFLRCIYVWQIFPIDAACSFLFSVFFPAFHNNKYEIYCQIYSFPFFCATFLSFTPFSLLSSCAMYE